MALHMTRATVSRVRAVLSRTVTTVKSRSRPTQSSRNLSSVAQSRERMATVAKMNTAFHTSFNTLHGRMRGAMLAKRVADARSMHVTSEGIQVPLPASAHTVSHRRRRLCARTGVVLVKKGMTGVYLRDGRRVAATALQFDRVQVVQCKSRKQGDKYFAVQVGAGAKRAETVNRALLGHFARHKCPPKRFIYEFQVSSADALMAPGTVIGPEWFTEGQCVDVRAKTNGKGFAGVMKRHGFKGMPATHGHSLSHRSAGSTGQNHNPGRVLPGKKMAGHMGNRFCTVQRMQIIKVMPELGVVLIKGSVPGPDGAPVYVRDTIKNVKEIVTAL